jgi:hypothetical protein
MGYVSDEQRMAVHAAKAEEKSAAKMYDSAAKMDHGSPVEKKSGFYMYGEEASPMESHSPLHKTGCSKKYRSSGLKMYDSAAKMETGDEPKISREQVKQQKAHHKSASGGLEFGEYVKVNKKTGGSMTKSIIPKINLPKINMPKVNINIDFSKKPKAKYGISKGKKGFQQLRKN